MNIIEALKSGKPWREVGINYWNPVRDMDNEMRLTVRQIYAEYEVKQEPREWNVYIGLDGSIYQTPIGVKLRTPVEQLRVREILNE